MLNGIARRVALLACTVSAAALIAGNASAQAKHYKLAYDQPVGTGYHVGGLIFAGFLVTAVALGWLMYPFPL